MVNRRTLLAAAPALALPACETMQEGNWEDTLAKIVTDGRLVIAGLQGAVAALGPLIPPSVKVVIELGIAQADDVLRQLGDARSAAEGKPLVQKLITYVQSVLSVIGGIVSIPEDVRNTLRMVSALLPVIGALVGIALPASSVPAPTARKALATKR